MAIVRITRAFKPGGPDPKALRVAERWYLEGEQFSCSMAQAEWFAETGCAKWIDKPLPAKRGPGRPRKEAS